MTVRLLINDITFLRRIVQIHKDDMMLVFDGEEAISAICNEILDREINAYITKIEKGTMYLDIYI